MTEQLGVSRRNLICGFVAAGAAVPLIAACGGSDSSAGTGATGGTGGTGGSGGAATGSIQTSEIPVGGGKIFPDRNIVVTQPTAGEFRAFSASCTHQGTRLDRIDGKDAVCPLHGSRFSIDDGSVVNGPASQPLSEKTVTVAADGTTLEVSG